MAWPLARCRLLSRGRRLFVRADCIDALRRETVRLGRAHPESTPGPPAIREIALVDDRPLRASAIPAAAADVVVDGVEPCDAFERLVGDPRRSSVASS